MEGTATQNGTSNGHVNRITYDCTPDGTMPDSIRVARRERRRMVAAIKPRCVYCGCGTDFANGTLDHIKPRSKGGKDTPGNLALCCRNCNSSKADRSPLGWCIAIILGAIRHRLAALIRG